MMIERLAIIGVGLIGGSLALALRAAGVVGQVVGCGRSQANLDVALSRGVIDAATNDPAAAADGADMVVVATALGASADIFRAVAGHLGPDCILTDVGSSKRGVIDAAQAALGGDFARFVPGHPIAGTERSGAEAAFATLYRGHKVVLTPVGDTDPTALARVRSMWAATGATVLELDPDQHDRALAATSHLPHLLAYNLVEALADRDDAAEIFAFAAGGFRDFTRIASSNARMWTEISLSNRVALLDAGRDYLGRLERMIDALEAGDGERLYELFERAQRTRDAMIVPESNAD